MEDGRNETDKQIGFGACDIVKEILKSVKFRTCEKIFPGHFQGSLKIWQHCVTEDVLRVEWIISVGFVEHASVAVCKMYYSYLISSLN